MTLPSSAKEWFDNAIELDELLTPLLNPPKDTHKPAGIRLAKMLGQYERRPSSELWSSIQSLALEILK
jgi:hypothetical protein